MIKQYTPERGDIIWIDFHPSTGREINKRRPALVMSPRALNEHGMTFVIPITSTQKDERLYPPLQSCKTIGQLIPMQCRALDLRAREAAFIEKAPQDAVDACANLLKHFMEIP